jgi:beta-lactamase regulating signal transducer with metallopeptidase domain
LTVKAASPSPIAEMSSRIAVKPRADVVAPLALAPEALAPTTPPLEPSMASTLTARVPWVVVLLLIYAGGVCSLVARLAFQQWTVRRLARRTTALDTDEWQRLLDDCAKQLGVGPGVRLRRSPDSMTPLAAGVWQPTIVVPAVADTWSDAARRAVLLHELAHVARRDCLTQLAAAFACALYWIHPGSWWLARRLRFERELACDDLVLSTGADAHEYAGHLLELAYTLRGQPAPSLAVGMAAQRQLETRIVALLDAACDRSAVSRRSRVAALAVFVALIVPIAASTARTVSASDEALASPSRHAAPAISREFVARLFTAEYWRHTAAEQLARLADQLKYLREMRQLGYSMADADVIFKLRQHGVTPEYVRALAAEGLSELSTDDLLIAAGHGISAEYVSDLKGLGYRSLDIAALARMRSYGVDGDFIRELRAFGYQWSMDDLAKARSHGLEPDYLLALSSLGYEGLTLDRLILLLSHGVDPSFIRALQELGYGDLTPEALVTLRSHGVTATRVKTANDEAGIRLTVEQLSKRASHGWRPQVAKE